MWGLHDYCWEGLLDFLVETKAHHRSFLLEMLFKVNKIGWLPWLQEENSCCKQNVSSSASISILTFKKLSNGLDSVKIKRGGMSKILTISILTFNKMFLAVYPFQGRKRGVMSKMRLSSGPMSNMWSFSIQFLIGCNWDKLKPKD